MRRRGFLRLGLGVSGAMVLSAWPPWRALGKSAEAASPGSFDELLASEGLDPSLVGIDQDAYVVVDPVAFARNIAALRQDMGDDVKLCLVMKSDAYGHGIGNLIREALAAQPHCLGLVRNDEIRQAVKAMEATGHQTRILRIAPATFFEAAEAVVNAWPVEETVGSVAQAEALSRIAVRLGEKRGVPVTVPIHINIDTGMGRMGFLRAEDIRAATALPGIVVKGVMTHYANAYDLERGEELTRAQKEKFDRMRAGVDFAPDVLVHTANSGASLRWPWTRCDMVRVGGALYGDIPDWMNPGKHYKDAMPAFKSWVVWVMDRVPPGTTVGYESVYRTPPGRDSTLATVKLGYNNGLPSWAWEKGTHVLIQGRRFPIVGNVSMNLTVVDVTDHEPGKPVKPGDEVVIFGRQGDQEISLAELEETSGVTTSGLMLAIGRINPRIVTGRPLVPPALSIQKTSNKPTLE